MEFVGIILLLLAMAAGKTKRVVDPDDDYYELSEKGEEDDPIPDLTPHDW